MAQNNFKVVYIRKNIAKISIVLLIIQLFIVVTGIENLPKMELPWKIVFFSFYSSIMFYIMITRLLYRVKVEGHIINVRTKFGRKYQLSCSDIDRVVCYSDYQSKGGPYHEIRLKVSLKKDVYVDSGMTGFQTMAGYILEKYECGEINPEAISKGSKKMLTQYKDMDLKK